MRSLLPLALALGAAAQSNPFADNLRRLDEASGVPPDTPEPDDEGPSGPDSDGACSDAIETGLSGDFDEITLYISSSAAAICGGYAWIETGLSGWCHAWLESFVTGNIDRVEAIISLGQEADQAQLQAQLVSLQAMLVQVQTLCVLPPPPPPSLPTITDGDIAAAGAIVGGVLIAVIAAPIGGILLLIVLIIVCVCCCCKKKATSPA
jgi:hypothetical protein